MGGIYPPTYKSRKEKNMGLGRALKKSKIANIISDPGSISGFGTNTRIGDWMNDLTGTTSAAKQSQQYALQSAAVANQYQKEFAQNAHQWEMADLEKAGINPILYAGGGAPAGSGNVNSAQMNASGQNPLEVASILSNIFQQGKQNKQIEAQTKLDKANTALQNTNVAKTTAEIQEIGARIKKIEEETKRIQGGQGTNFFGTNAEKNPVSQTLGGLFGGKIMNKKELGNYYRFQIGLLKGIDKKEAEKMEKTYNIAKKKGLIE